jgi:hypothetical protein
MAPGPAGGGYWELAADGGGSRPVDKRPPPEPGAPPASVSAYAVVAEENR